MIVVDTSALMAIVINEPVSAKCARAIEDADEILISAGTLTEILIVAAGKNLTTQMETLLRKLVHAVVPVTRESAIRTGAAYHQWGKGFHPAGLNFGDCFAYTLAMERNCPLLFVGNDFSKTDVISATPIENAT